jgi:trigger factor
MLTMDRINDIRLRYYMKGENISQIASKLQLDWKTVQKYVDMTDFNEPDPKPASEQRLCPKLDPYKPTIDKWLKEDKQSPRKQRHTAKRVFTRLKKEIPGFNCSYRTVASYYAVKHRELFSDARNGFLPLEHHPGEAFLEIEVGADKLEEGMQFAYRTVVKKVTVPGFRKGKVPRPLLEAYYGKEVLYEDALEHIIPQVYDEAVKALEIKVMGQPAFDFDLETIDNDEQPFVIKATVAVEPEVVLGPTEGLEIKVPDFPVSDEMVEKRIDEMRSSYAQVVDKSDPSEMGDTLLIDFEGFMDGVPFDGGKGEDYQLLLGSNTFIPGFEEQLTGLKAGDEKEVEVTFPDDYQAEELAGQAAVFKVAVKGVQCKQMRELNDEFAQEISEFETLDELREDIKKSLLKASEVRRQDALRQAALEKLMESTPVVLAESAIKAQAINMAQQLEQRLMTQGISLEQYLTITNSNVEMLLNSIKPDAERQLKTSFILDITRKFSE